MSQTHFTRRHAPRASRGAGPKHPDALVLAQRYASEWAATERPEVVCDGDPHPGNVLRREAGWALIDPDGIVGERADDLGVVLRDACGEIVLTEASEPGSGTHVSAWACRQLADLANADPDRVWRWGFVERVTTGLYLRWFGYAGGSATFLDTAAKLASSGRQGWAPRRVAIRRNDAVSSHHDFLSCRVEGCSVRRWNDQGHGS